MGSPVWHKLGAQHRKPGVGWINNNAASTRSDRVSRHMGSPVWHKLGAQHRKPGVGWINNNAVSTRSNRVSCAVFFTFFSKSHVTFPPFAAAYIATVYTQE